VKLSLNGLKQLCATNVVELRFNRRRPQGYNFPHRRMICTIDPAILDSQLGIEILNFKRPFTNASYNAASKNLLTVWDIIMQVLRNIPVESVDFVATVPSFQQFTFAEYVHKKQVKHLFQLSSAHHRTTPIWLLVRHIII
jgi:hypothetical protein